MQTLDELLHEAEIAHGHLCAGQILGVRMAMLGCRLLGIDDPRGPHSPDRKRLVTFVEIDRCATDAIGVVTGCRLGKRALKFRDWGKMAASFIDLGRPARPELGLPDAIQGGRAVRIAALESSKDRAREMYPEIENKNAQQMRAYRELPDNELFSWEWVDIPLHPREMPGYKAGRIVCDECGEGINFDRHVVRDEERNGTRSQRILCRACAEPESRYYRVLRPGTFD